MLKMEKVDETNRQRIIDSLKTDIIRHVFAYYDIQHEPEHTTTYAAFENGNLDGYILTYTAVSPTSIVLESDHAATAEQLITYAPEDYFIMHAPPNLLPVIQRRFPDAKHYIENWMLVRKGKAKLYKSDLVKQLHTNDDALQLAKLLSTRKDRPERAVEKYMEWLSKMRMYGVFIDEKLVSYSGSFLQIPQVWMIGGVYTHPDHRSKGYSTLATSAITEEALRNAEAAALFVRSDNYPAIRVYEKIGYKKISENIWADVGTGLSP